MKGRLEHWLAKLPPDYGQDAEGEKALVVGLETPRCHGDELTLELEELTLLLSNLGVYTLGQERFRREVPHLRGLFGPGQIQRLKELIDERGATVLVVNDSLTPLQRSTLRESCLCEVWDRGLVITRIFEARASSAESQAQLGLAKLKGALPGLRGLGKVMSRSGAGIGTRGSGETEYERHRRKLSRQEINLRRKVSRSAAGRASRRRDRQRAGLPLFALVGYTNSGKTTLLGALTGDRSLKGEDKLFATLDPRTRRLVWPDGRVALLTDTVGFLRRLPPELEASFTSTLEEIQEAAALLLVLDVKDPRIDETADVVMATLAGLGVADLPLVVCLNKADQVPEARLEGLKGRFANRTPYVVSLSALTGEGVPQLKELLGCWVKGGASWFKA